MSVLPSGVRGALTHDTRFPHSVNDSNALPFAFGNGPQPITQQPPTGFDVATAYTGSNDNALGPAANEAAINYGVFMDREAWNDRSTGPEMLNFIRAKTRSAMGTGEVYEALSLSSLNWNLKNDVNFQAEFFHPTANSLMETYKLFGVQNGEASYSDLDDAPFVLHHVARRAKFPNYWSSLDSLKTHRGSVRENDELWLLIRRYEHETPLQITKRRNKNSPGALTHYWQLEPYVSSGQSCFVSLWFLDFKLCADLISIFVGLIGVCVC